MVYFGAVVVTDQLNIGFVEETGLSDSCGVDVTIHIDAGNVPVFILSYSDFVFVALGINIGFVPNTVLNHSGFLGRTFLIDDSQVQNAGLLGIDFLTYSAAALLVN